MSKDAYYFPHDSNAKDDPKCVLLIEQLGLEGYGIYWILIETLRDQPEYKYPMKLISALARRYNTTAEKMKAVITGYDLFEITDDEFFLSPSLKERMLRYDEKKEKARMAAKERWKKEIQSGSERNANAEQTQSDSNASKGEKSKGEKSKGEKSKGNENKQFTPPSVEQVREYCQQRENSVDAERFVNFYSSKGWMIGSNKMKDWKAAVRTWERKNGENKQNRTKTGEKKLSV